MSGPRPRVVCPVCRRQVALDPSGTIRYHRDNLSPGGGEKYWCVATGKLPRDAGREAEQARLAELVAKYPDRARELVAQLPSPTAVIGECSEN